MSTNEKVTTDLPPLCARCLKTLEPGRGEFYVVRIEALADPTPPTIIAEDLTHDYQADWRKTVAALQEVTPQEAMDQVYRRVVIHLCNSCYRDWIENPAG
jgi:hypothetical protein